jgi:peptidoglycan/xylan/chitin deacetylase (PgdA/CDA1 family)
MFEINCYTYEVLDRGCWHTNQVVQEKVIQGMFKIFFTFDCEDFINHEAICSLNRILGLLRKHELRAVFFLTGYMAEKLRDFPEILNSLEEHEIGYHSTSHSVHPTIFEYTDVENYETAYAISLKREQSRINPLTGEIEGKGGFLLFKDVFPSKKIVAFRAPGFCWSPPHLEALTELGFRFDFSTNLSRRPIRFKGVTFYPFPMGGYYPSSLKPWISLSIFHYTVLLGHTGGHPGDFGMGRGDPAWDSIYYSSNPTCLPLIQKNRKEDNNAWRNFELFVSRVGLLAETGLLHVTPPLKEGISKTDFTKEDVMRSYRRSIKWAQKIFNYKPRFLLRHFFEYFNVETELAEADQKALLS